MRIIFALAIITLITSLSCQKKIEFNEAATEYSNIETRFFNLLPNADPMLQKVANDLKKKERTKPFIRNWVKNNGYPLWNKAIVVKGNTDNAGRTSSNTDSFAIIPFSIPGSNAVRSVLNSRINDTIDYRFLEQHKYWQAGFQPNTIPNANHFMGLIMYTDNLAFGHENFWFRDSRLFKANPNAVDSGKYQFVKFKPHIPASGRTNGVVYQVCYDVTAPCNGQVTGCNPGDPCNPYCTTTHCQDLFVWFESDQNQYLNPFGATYWANNPPIGGGGTASGGGGDAQLDENGNLISYVLFPMVRPSIIKDSLTNPCLVEAKSRLTNEKLTNFIIQSYYTIATKFAEIRFVEDSTLTYENSTILAPSACRETPPGSNIWRIILNPRLFRPATSSLTTIEYAACTILHEIVHVLINYKKELGLPLALDPPHIQMFFDWTRRMATTLREAFPGMSTEDSFALALSGINDKLGVEFDGADRMVYDGFFNQMAVDRFGISTVAADSISQEYKNQIKGTLCP